MSPERSEADTKFGLTFLYSFGILSLLPANHVMYVCSFVHFLIAFQASETLI